ncbi:MAG: phospho-N-acetylmuramoyl-pentapeptide-transferase [Elusimicrobiota bacterium]
MLYHLLYPLKQVVSGFNIFQYITFRSSGALLTALIISFILGPWVIKKLKDWKFTQTIRTDGPQTHLQKSGTPTMGGLLILLSLVVSTLLWARWDNRFTWLILITTLVLGALGFYDDYLKLTRKNVKGVPPAGKMVVQFLLALGVTTYLFFYPPNTDFTTTINIPYLKDVFLELGFIYLFFSMLLIISASNAVNLTDGLDGLAIGVAMISAVAYLIFSYFAGNAKFAAYLRIIPVRDASELAIYLAAFIGAGLGFLWYNAHPAEVFMGDTGSLFIGGMLGVTALCVKQEVIIVLVGAVFLIEIMSVVIQVYSFRRFGKRVFRMAPLHHHFELKGWAENKVTIRFWIIAIIFCLIALGSLKIR